VDEQSGHSLSPDEFPDDTKADDLVTYAGSDGASIGSDVMVSDDSVAVPDTDEELYFTSALSALPMADLLPKPLIDVQILYYIEIADTIVHESLGKVIGIGNR
jgi:hypothetical protein